MLSEQRALKARIYLFLQGPASPFLRHVAAHLDKAGKTVLHVSFCLGDRIFWAPRSSIHFKDEPAEWPAFIGNIIREHGVTDLLMLGDGRPVHAEAIDVAMPLGCRIHILEHGYIRPDWLTLEPDGMSGHSRFPRDPAELARLSEGKPLADLKRLYPFSFLTYALYDLLYHLPNVALGWLLHPHYRRHGPVHPLVEYSGWIWKAIKRPAATNHRKKVLIGLLSPHTPFFLFPLQLPGDYQIKVHAPGGDLFALVHAVIAHFAAHAPRTTKLLFKIHPIDNGLSRWHSRIARTARNCGIEGRVLVIDGGSLDGLIGKADGVVTINSTVGTTALIAGKPLIALGNAIFDTPGLTHQGSLAAFWSEPTLPDAAVVDHFFKALVDTVQLRGGFIGAPAIEAGSKAVAIRIMEECERLPLAARRNRHESHFRYGPELFAKTPIDTDTGS